MLDATENAEKVDRDPDAVYIVRLGGVVRQDDLQRCKERFEAELGGKVIVIDDTVRDIFRMSSQDAAALAEKLESWIGGAE